MKLIAYLVPDDFEDWKMPQRLKEEGIISYEEKKVLTGKLNDTGPWLALGHSLGLAFWRKLGGGK